MAEEKTLEQPRLLVGVEGGKKTLGRREPKVRWAKPTI